MTVSDYERAWRGITENVPVGQVFVTQRFLLPREALEAFLADLAEAARRAGGSMFGGTTAEVQEGIRPEANSGG